MLKARVHTRLKMSVKTLETSTGIMTESTLGLLNKNEPFQSFFKRHCSPKNAIMSFQTCMLIWTIK